MIPPVPVVLAAVAVLTVWSVWVTRPEGTSLPRHLGALLAQAWLDVVRAVLRAAAAVVAVLVVLALAWGMLAPRVADAVGSARDQAVSSARDAVVPHVSVPGWLPWGHR